MLGNCFTFNLINHPGFLNNQKKGTPQVFFKRRVLRDFRGEGWSLNSYLHPF